MKIAVLDLDGTLWNFHSGYANFKNETEIKNLMFPEAPQCLELLKSKKVPIAIASASPRKDYCLKYFEVLFPDFTFDFIHIELTSKIKHFKLIKDFFKCEYSDMYFYDDQENFLSQARSLKINAINARGGLKIGLFDSILKL